MTVSLVVSYHSAKDATTRFSPLTFQPRSPMLVGLYQKRTLVITLFTGSLLYAMIWFDCLKDRHVQGTSISWVKHDYSWPLRQMIKFFIKCQRTLQVWRLVQWQTLSPRYCGFFIIFWRGVTCWIYHCNLWYILHIMDDGVLVYFLNTTIRTLPLHEHRRSHHVWHQALDKWKDPQEEGST